jgi:proteasome assembly chaperone (PAC2) family protein
MAKLKMTQIAEFPSRELFDIDHIDVEGGLIQPVRLPRNRFFSWADPNGAHDLVVFLGEAQPPAGNGTFRRGPPPDRVPLQAGGQRPFEGL